MANEFSDYFEEKIIKIRAKFPSTSKFNEYDETVDVTPLTSFQPLSKEDIRKLILSAAPKSCSLDPIPTSLLKDCIELLLPSISKVINMSLIQGEMPEGFKHAVVTPLPKKTDVDPTFKNFRPVSNLPFLSKMIEKAVAIQLLDHTNSHNLCENLQSAYRCHHSTETALIKIMNDLLLEADNQKVILMGFLDLSAAFDTVDHCILLHRLEKMFRIEDKALDWFRTYLTGRTQSVVVGDCESHKKVLECCVPQGSGLGPDLYCKYTLPLGIIIRMFHILYHMYADDIQLYKSIDPSNFENQKQTAEQLHLCTSEISNWMSNNRLKLNEEKTEFLIAGTGRHRSKVIIDSLNVLGIDIKPSTSVRNLGVIIDQDLSLKEQVNAICRSCYGHLRSIIQIRPYLTKSAAHTIVQSLISSRLDYCNSLLAELPQYLIHKLQKVQNWAARIVLNVKKHDSISVHLHQLHWLPVRFRIKFKINLLVYKSLNRQAPSYLTSMLNYQQHQRTTRLARKSYMLQEKRSKLVSMGDRAFSVVAPKYWNELPDDIKNIELPLDIFKKKLKTHYFKTAYCGEKAQ